MKGRFDAVIQGRINWVLLFFCVILFVILTKLFLMQIVDHKEYISLASKQHRLDNEIFPERGSIFVQDKDGKLHALALNKIQKILVSAPRDVKEPEVAAEVIAEELGLSAEEVRQKLSNSSDAYEVISKKVDSDSATRLEAKKIKGLFFEEEKKRVYPYGSLGAHILGFVSKEKEVEIGKYGLEEKFEKELSGNTGFMDLASGSKNSFWAIGKSIVNPAKDGSNLILTVDFNIQNKLEQVLKQARQKWNAAAASGLVLDPSTGRILALVALPVFDPNEFSKEKDYQVFLNPLVQSMYELGSVIKPITMSSALSEGLLKPDTTYNDTGIVNISGYNINNSDGKAYKVQTMTEVLEKSLNTGAVFVSKLLGKDKQLEYLKKFGFGSKTGIDMPGEVSGNISNLNNKREIDFATASFGQGIAVTPIQMASAIGAIANKGILMKPYIVEKIIDSSGNEKTYGPEIMRSVISREASEDLTKMLVSVVRKGYDSRAGVRGYFVAGKTGTAQIPRQDRRGYSDDVIHSFVGYAPAFSPRFLVFLQLNKPEARFAGTTLPAHFQELANFILNYYEVPPDEK